MKCIVTGGAGFIGSHLAATLLRRGDDVTIIDNLSAGREENIPEGAVFIRADLLKEGWEGAFAGAERVYHIAADPDVRASAGAPDSVFSENVYATVRVMEAMRNYGVKEIVFTSTSTVYGEATVIPTPENYSPLEPISIYAGSKLAAEAMISAYTATYGWKAWVFRFANIIGPRSSHGVIWDFVHKLKDNPDTLEILGDGKQIKSYLSVEACVDGVLYAAGHADKDYNVFNVGSEDWISVNGIADIITEEMGLIGVEFRYTGGDRGWVGDVPRMQLATEKIQALGWTPPVGSAESVRLAVRALLDGDLK